MKDDKQDEKFSAFVDNELEASEFEKIVASLQSDDDLKQRWQRYHIISDAMQKHLPENVDCRLADRVRLQIEKEPTVIAPNVNKQTKDKSPAGFSYITTPAPTTSNVTPLFKQLAGFAVAASVMVVAVFVTQSFSTQGTIDVDAPIAKVRVMPDQSQFARVAKSQTRRLPSGFENKLNKYLANHNQYSKTAPGVLPYARIIGYTQDNKPIISNFQKSK